MQEIHSCNPCETDDSHVRYGVARVYAQQCGYVLHDAQAAKNSLRDVFKAPLIDSLERDGALKGRPDQLILQDDPKFLPDFNLMPVDLDLLDFETTAIGGSQRATLSPYGSQHDLSSPRYNGGLVLPQSDSSFYGGGPMGNFGSFGFQDNSGPGSGPAARYKHAALLEDDLGIALDLDGDLVMDRGPIFEPASFANLPGNTALGCVSPLMRREKGHHDHQVAESGKINGDDVIPTIGDDLPMELLGDLSARTSRYGYHSAVLSTTSETADAPIRRRARAPLKIISADDAIELRNSDLARWSAEYAAKMMGANQHKHALRASGLAKKNAEYWVLGTGIGILDRRADHVAGVFSTIDLLERLLNVRIASSALKRSRPEEDDNSDTIRRVRSRQRSQSRELARDAFQDDYMPVIMDDTIEQGREAPTPLDDHRLSTAFPWHSGSQRPSNILSAGGLPSSVGGAPFMPISRRGSRLISHSPLENHGLRGLHMNATEIRLPGPEMHVGLTSEDEFELYGPAANVDTQTAAQSQWQRSILDSENANFLAFVQTAIDEADRVRAIAPAGDEEDERFAGSVEFDTLLPLHRNTHIVAAQALLHILALGTKSLLRIQQNEAYGPIIMSTTVTVP
nr:hypothetical protein CFP56_07450 [Quercus suber]